MGSLGRVEAQSLGIGKGEEAQYVEGWEEFEIFKGSRERELEVSS